MLTVRSAAPDDAKRLLEIYSYYVINTAVSFEYDVPSEAEFRSRIENTLQKYPYIVLERDGFIVGYAYAGTFKNRAAYDRCCEVSVYLDKNERRKGYGKTLYGELEKRLYDQGILNLYACIAFPTEEDAHLTKDSVLFHTASGYVKVGEFHKCGYKFGRFYDMIWMEKFIGDHRGINEKTV